MRKSWPHPIKAVLFDNDGVVMDTIKIYAKANSIVIGQDYPDELQVKINGLQELEFAQAVINHFGLNMTPVEFVRDRQEILKEIMPTCQPVPGVTSIIEKLTEMGIPIALATSANRESLNVKFGHHQELFHKFKAVVCGDEVTRAKPSPEIFQVASKKLGDYNPENVLVIEDSYMGIKAACDAQMASIFLNALNDDPQVEFQRIGSSASFVIKSFNDFDFNAFDWSL